MNIHIYYGCDEAYMYIHHIYIYTHIKYFWRMEHCGAPIYMRILGVFEDLKLDSIQNYMNTRMPVMAKCLFRLVVYLSGS